MIRYSTATWNGSGMTGQGRLTSESNSLADLPFNFDSRFKGNVAGTNPEELLAAAHASCFTMKLSFVLGEAGYVPESLQTTANVSFINGAITGSRLVVHAAIPGMTVGLLEEKIAEAERCCPISRALQIAVTFEAFLEP